MAARFVRESRLAGALNHPSIVTVLDFFEHDGTPYIAMEYVPRGSLRPWVGRLTVAQVGGVLESVLAGLAHAHAGSVVHRDLKPENLMVTDDGHVKITDFGIAKALIDSETVAFRTATGATIGTPAYMSPEQAMGEGVGPWTDLYATGVIAYELLSGSVPFGNREPMAILLAHCQEAPVPLAERAPGRARADRRLGRRAAGQEPRRPPALRATPPGRSSRSTCSTAPARAGAAAPASRASRAPSAPAGRPITPAQFPSEVWQTYETPATAEAAPRPAHVAGRPAPRRPTRHAAARDPSPHRRPPTPSRRPPRRPPPHRRPRPPRRPRRRHRRPRAPTPPDATATPPARVPRRPTPPPRHRPRVRRTPPAATASPRRRRRPPRPSPATPPLAARRRGLSPARARRPRGRRRALASRFPASRRRPRAASTAAPADGPVPLGEDWMRAVHVVSYEPEGLTKPGFVDAVRRAKADGATHVVLRPDARRPTRSSPRSSRTRPTRRPTRRSPPASTPPNARACSRSSSPRSSPRATTRARTSPVGPGRVLRRPTRQRLEAWADIAGEHGADAFVVGTMFSQLDGPDYTDRWTALLNDTRERCDCLVTYSAEDVEGAERIEFWDAADAIGVIPLAALTDEPTNDVETLTRAWDPLKQRMQKLNERWEQARHPHRPRLRSRWRTRRPTPVTEAARRALRGGAGRALRGRLPRVRGQRLVRRHRLVRAQRRRRAARAGRLLVRRQAGRRGPARLADRR